MANMNTRAYSKTHHVFRMFFNMEMARYPEKYAIVFFALIQPDGRIYSPSTLAFSRSRKVSFSVKLIEIILPLLLSSILQTEKLVIPIGKPVSPMGKFLAQFKNQ